MRQIKFRVWDVQNKNFVKDSLLENINSYFTAADGTINWFRNDNEYAIQQFTGLKDVNGVDIYEGDIVELTVEGVTYGINEIQITTYRLVVDFHNGVFQAKQPLHEINKWCKVVGNIFEDKKNDT